MREFALETAAFAASHTSRRTWLCRHVYRPLARAYVHLLSTWCSVSVPPQSPHLVSSTKPHFCKLSLEGNWSYTDLIAKASRSGDIFHISLQVRDRCITSSHVVHLPCCDCWTALVTRSCSTFRLLSWLIIAALVDELAWDHFGRWFHPTAWRSVWVGPLTSSNVSSATDSSISFCARNFLPDLSSGLTSRILLSAELLSIHCVLILESLYSSTMDLSGSRRLVLLL